MNLDQAIDNLDFAQINLLHCKAATANFCRDTSGIN